MQRTDTPKSAYRKFPEKSGSDCRKFPEKSGSDCPEFPEKSGSDYRKFPEKSGSYGAIKSGGRAREFELAIQWLQDAGLVLRVNRATKPNLPLKFYEDLSAFKLYLLDTGLLGALANIPPEQILTKDNELSASKGAFTENYVVTQIATTRDTTMCYFSNDNHTLEIDMLLQERSNIWPIEIKAEENLRSKSLSTFVKTNPNLIVLRF